MRVSVYDTYVTKANGALMHFDILVPTTVTDTAKVHSYGRAYLTTKGQTGRPLATKECRYCHIEQATPEVEASIAAHGYHIIEMQGC